MAIICQHCNSESGFYVRETVTGSATVYYTEKGDYASEQGDMYGHVNHKGGKNAYCSQCHKIIGKSERLITGNAEEHSIFGN